MDSDHKQFCNIEMGRGKTENYVLCGKQSNRSETHCISLFDFELVISKEKYFFSPCQIIMDAFRCICVALVGERENYKEFPILSPGGS